MQRAKVGVIAVWVCLVAVGGLLPARTAATSANDLCPSTDDPCIVDAPISVTDGSVIDVGSRQLVIEAGGSLSVGPGRMTIRARQLRVAPAIASPVRAAGALLAQGNPSDDGGVIAVEAGEITVAGLVDATGLYGGKVVLQSAGDLSVSGVVAADARSTEGGGGQIELTGATVSVSGNVTDMGGSFEFGGDVTVHAAGDLDLSGRVDVKGGSGGSAELIAGYPAGAGNLLLTETSVIDASGKAGGDGGDVDISSNGDGVASGHMTLNGRIAADAGPELGGEAGDGGLINVTAKGNVTTDNKRARISAPGGGGLGSGGDIEIVASTWSSVAAIDVGTSGTGGGGGFFSADARGEITIAGPISGEGGSDVQITSSTAGLTVAVTGSIGAGDDGAILLEAGTLQSGTAARVVIAGPLTAGGGSIEITGRDSVELSGDLTADGAGSGADGGSIMVTADDGPVQVKGTSSARGKGTGAKGGSLSIEAGTVLKVEGRLDASCAGGSGGDIGLLALGRVEVSGTLLALTVDSGHGGQISVISTADDVRISGRLTSDSGSEQGAPGGTNMVEGCTVTIEKSGQLSGLGVTGSNRISGRGGTVVFGSVQADPATGVNEFRYRDAAGSPFFNAGSSVIPDPTLILDPNLRSCVECGNGNPEPPETCDDGNQTDGDGCSRDCQLEIPGDANANGVLSTADLDAVIEEVFDGDGDRVGMVAEGTFAGGAGADANGDQRITAADLTKIAKLLEAPQQ